MIEFWAAALALTLLLYVVLDGFDLGVGMLFPFAPDEEARRHMLASISPVWDGNETWLVVSAAVLFGAFPLVYSLLLSAFYLPLLVMLCALILRGVAFEFRAKAGGFMRWVWDAGFVGGSYAASFVQGVTVGALVQGLPVTDGRYTGGPFSWLGALPLLCGVGLCLGYCLLGAGWLSYRTSQDVHDLAYRWLPRLLVAVGVFLVLAFVLSLALELRVMHRWIERPILIVFPLAGALACAVMLRSIRNRRDLVPFLCTIALFVTAFLTLAMSFLPYMVPFSVTIEQAAAPHSSLAFLFWGAGIFVLPLTLIYTLIVYFVFKGKIDPTAKYH
jgi:cytochrome d ubiquinol oxidase subunit II